MYDVIYTRENKMRKILAINPEPVLRTYTYHGYAHAIMSAEGRIRRDESKAIAKIRVNDFDSYQWKIKNEELRYEVEEDNQISFYCNHWNHGMNLTMYRECSQQDEIELCVYDQIYPNARSAICAYITSPDQKDIYDIKSYLISAASASKYGIYYCERGKWHTSVEVNPQMPVVIRLIKEDKDIYLEYASADKKRTKILIKTLMDDEPLIIGFAVDMYHSDYYEWMFSNYINIYGDYSNSYRIRVDYLCNLHKEFNTYTCDYMLNYLIENETSLKVMGFTVLEYIKRQIDLERYIDIDINDHMHTGESDEKRKFFHQNLIYGYDDEQSKLYLLYYYFGEIRKAELSYEMFLSERNEQYNREVRVIRYNPRNEMYEFSKEHLLQQYIEYRDGVNISFYEPNLYKRCYFGLRYLNYLCTPAGIDNVMSDTRISYLMYEHTLCNKSRVEYLYFIHMLNETTYQELEQILDEKLVYTTNLMDNAARNMIRRYHNVNKEGNKQTFLEMMNSVLQYEAKFVDRMIRALQEP